MTSELLAQMVLAFSAVDVGQTEKWSDAQISLINNLADTAASCGDLGSEEVQKLKAQSEKVFSL
jgi:hypothetical protein